METDILGVKLSDRVQNSILRSEKHTVGIEELSWTRLLHAKQAVAKVLAVFCFKWIPENAKRNRGRSNRRWRDELDVYVKICWLVAALNRDK